MRLKETIQEVLYGILPITIIITVLQFTIIQLPSELYLQFLGGTVLVTVGLILFLLGIEVGFLPMGERIGASLVEKGSLRLILIFSFIIGFAVTIPEPDVQALVAQVQTVSDGQINRAVLVLLIALGVGLFVMLGMLKMFLNIPIRHFLAAGYGLVFLLLAFTPPTYARIAFDAGGVTTGSLTVPFIMSLGVGVASATAKKDSAGESFGILALASLGPVLAVLLMGVSSG